MTTRKRILARVLAYMLGACLAFAYAVVVGVSFLLRRWPRDPR